jgi:uncharacterized protein (DUF305 family)
VRHRLGWWVVMAVLAAGCTTPASNRPTASDQTDVWFMQHMVPYLRQTTSVVSLTREHLTDRALARLADTVTRRSQADIDQLQGLLDRRGLSPHGHSHQRVDNRRQTDLERLSQLRGSALDLSFVQVMTARSRAGATLAAGEARDGSLPEVRQLARQLLAEQQAQAQQLRAWRHTRAAAGHQPPGSQGSSGPRADTAIGNLRPPCRPRSKSA